MISLGARRTWLLLLPLLPISPARSVAAILPDSSLASQAQALIYREIAKDGPGAAVLIVKGDRVLYRAARGRADIELAVPLEPDDVFRIGSITKTFTAATVLALVSEGRLSTDDHLSRFFPQYPNGNNISIAQLLDHTAGISDAWNANPADDLDSAKLLKLIESQPPDFAPGTEWRYSNSGYILLGEVVEAVTGKPWYAATRDLVLTPLGLTHTGYHGDSELVYARALGYSRSEAGETIRAPYASMTGPAAAGALSSTVDDLSRFMRALATGHILPAQLYRLMTTTKATSSGQSINYGYGVMLGTVRGEPAIEHNGGIDGFATELAYFPNKGVTVVVLANSDAGLAGPRSLAHRLGALAIGKPYPSLRESVLDAKTLARLAGSYRIDPSSIHTLLVHDGKLFVRRDGGPEQQLASTRDGALFYVGDETDYYEVIRDTNGNVVALDFYGDGMEPARHEARIER